MKILHLTLKKKWFDMIASGDKKEEYRELKMYWWKRLVCCGECYSGLEDSLNNVLAPTCDWKMIMANYFDAVKFNNGYSKNAPSITVEWNGLEIGQAKPEWSDNWQGDVFIIKLGEILNLQP